MKTTAFIILLLLMSTPLSLPAWAQYDVPNSVVGNGAAISTGDHIVYCTVGQPAIGTSSDLSNICHHGFWYPAGITSTVDVAISAFWAEYLDDIVVLHWHAKADASFEGFHVYREHSASPGPEYTRLNDELIPPAAECTFTDDNVMPGNIYRYRIGAVQGEDEFFSVDIEVSLPPKALTLYQNYPNPFNPSTTIRCFLPKEGVITIDIIDVSGKRIQTLVNKEKYKGFFKTSWDGRDEKGNPVGSGLYFYRLKTGGKTLTKKMLLLK